MKVILISGKANHGKDLTANILKGLIEDSGKKVLITHFADLLKYIAKNFFEWNGDKDIAGRELLQRIGTDTIRKKDPDYWVRFMSNFLKLFPDEWDYVLIPDARFPNEIDKMSQDGLDVVSIRVNRLGFESQLTKEQKEHASETALDNYLFDYYICNNGGLELLNEEVAKLWNALAFI